MSGQEICEIRKALGYGSHPCPKQPDSKYRCAEDLLPDGQGWRTVCPYLLDFITQYRSENGIAVQPRVNPDGTINPDGVTNPEDNRYAFHGCQVTTRDQIEEYEVELSEWQVPLIQDPSRIQYDYSGIPYIMSTRRITVGMHITFPAPHPYVMAIYRGQYKISSKR